VKILYTTSLRVPQPLPLGAKQGREARGEKKRKKKSTSKEGKKEL
jgi:hypothetical protein